MCRYFPHCFHSYSFSAFLYTTYQKWKAIRLEILFTIICRPPNISQAAAVEQVVEQELDNQFSREPTVAGAIYEVVHKEFIKLEAYWLRKEGRRRDKHQQQHIMYIRCQKPKYENGFWY